MAIDRERGVRVVSVGELLAEDLRIPSYQRPYAWTPETARQLLTDIEESARSSASTDSGGEAVPTTYVLGSTILHRDEATGELHVVDGQQRLLTLVMMLDLLDDRARGEVTRREARSGHTDQASANTMSTDAAAPDSLPAESYIRPVADDSAPDPAEVPQAPVMLARHALRRQVARLANPSALADYIRTKCALIRVETDDQDEAFRVFDSQNYRGKSLLPHDILKAYHLRHMDSESSAMKAALVEGWESVDEEELDRIFSTYLWRIKRWSRGFSALPRFSTQHVADFKGLTSKGAQTPFGRYHLVAQTAMPLLSLSTAPSHDSSHTQQRSRFQIDAPVVAGGPFFEMVTFMLDEVRRLRSMGYTETREAAETWEAFASTRPDDFSEISAKARYRYVSELYLAALLYYTNRFGDLNLAEVRERLFTWAYTLRVKYQRVQFATVNKYAAETRPYLSPFVLLRNAENPGDLRHLAIPKEIEDRTQDSAFESSLVKLLKEMGE